MSNKQQILKKYIYISIFIYIYLSIFGQLPSSVTTLIFWHVLQEVNHECVASATVIL